MQSLQCTVMNEYDCNMILILITWGRVLHVEGRERCSLSRVAAVSSKFDRPDAA